MTESDAPFGGLIINGRTLRVVVDTNVLVAALLTPGRVADQALIDLVGGSAQLLVDDRIVAEYREVLARPKFRSVQRVSIEATLTQVLAQAELVVSTTLVGALEDEDDRAFLEVAVSGRADAIVTGNAKHFPRDLGVAILSPAEWLALRSADRPTAE